MEPKDPPWSPHPDAALEERLIRGDREALLGVLAEPSLLHDPYARLRALDRLHGMDSTDPRLLQAWLQAMLLGNRPLRAWQVTGTWPCDAATPAGPQLLAAQVAQAVGRRDEARSRYRELLVRHPRWVDAWQKYVEFEDRDGRPAGTVATLEDILAAGPTDYDREKAGFALSRVLASDEPGRAFQLAASAQARKRLRCGPWNRAALQARLRDDLDWTPALCENPCNEVFIVGLPRSGTTLLASLLGAHPSIANTGEQNLIPALAAARACGQAGSDPLLRGRARDWYRSAVADLAGEARVVVDKLPGNAEHCGLALALFPSALVVHIERDLDDCATSIHMHDFEFGCDYASDAADLGHYAGAIREHLRHFAGCAAGRLVHLRFDDLARAPEAALRPLLSRLGLDWDPRMLDFWQDDVQTASYSEAQVRTPVHTRTLGSARRFLPDSAGFLAAVRAGARKTV